MQCFRLHNFEMLNCCREDCFIELLLLSVEKCIIAAQSIDNQKLLNWSFLTCWSDDCRDYGDLIFLIDCD